MHPVAARTDRVYLRLRAYGVAQQKALPPLGPSLWRGRSAAHEENRRTLVITAVRVRADRRLMITAR